MDSETNVLRDLDITTYLHFNHKKFWEITLNGYSFETVIRFGKLLENDLEEPLSVQTFRKTHGSLEDGYQYVEQHINLKKSKGYQRLIKDSRDLNTDSSSLQKSVSNLASSGLKRKNEEPLVPDTLKKVLKNEDKPHIQSNPFEDFELEEVEPIEQDIMQIEKEIKSAALKQSQSSEKRWNNDESNKIQSQKETKPMSQKVSQPNDKKPIDDSNAFNIDPNTFKGAYLVKEGTDKQFFCKVQVLKSYVKTENGVVKDSRSITCQYRIYENRAIAMNKAKDEITQRISQGYKIKNEFFSFDFTESEAGLKLGLMQKLPKSTPASPTRPTAESPKKEQPKEHAKKQNSNATEELESDGEVSDALSYDLDDFRKNNFNKKPELKRSESRVRSASQEKTSTSKDEANDELGKPVKGIYDSLQLPQKWTSKKNPNGWYITKRLDGVRCFWDGHNFWSKKGKKYNVPDFFHAFFPQSPLDGELYISQGSLQRLSSILQKKKPKDEDWNDIKFIVYDAPELKIPFKKRLEKMRKVLSVPVSPYILLCEYTVCQNKAHLMKILDEVEKEGGEGLVLRDPQGFYEKGKSNSVLEVSAYHEDEATIEGYESGKGKYECQIGGLKVRNVYGIEFVVSIGLTDTLRKNPPKVGTKIKYRFKGVNEDGVPKFPTLIRNEEE